jgi:hypothetical protein
MRNPSPVPGIAARESRETETGGGGSAAPDATGRAAGDRAQAAQGSLPEPVSAATNLAPRTDSPAEAQGRRILSTAFVRVGPDEQLTVELRDGRAIVLRDLVMRPRDYCGVQVLGGSAGTRYCGGYGDVAAARPGGAPAPDAVNPAALDPAEPGRGPSGRG